MATEKQSKVVDELSKEVYQAIQEANKNYKPWSWRLGRASQEIKVETSV